jgi:hypothetical protein
MTAKSAWEPQILTAWFSVVRFLASLAVPDDASSLPVGLRDDDFQLLVGPCLLPQVVGKLFRGRRRFG